MCSTFLKLLIIGLVGSLAIVKAEDPHADDEPESENGHEDEEEVGSHWSYEGDHGPQHWGDMYGGCADQRQSPIDIQTDTVVPADFEKLSLKYYFSTPRSMSVVNNGHTVQLEVDMDQMPWITGGGYLDDYEFKQLHFHWGSEVDKGSEHTVDGLRAPLEMHLVHLNRKYDSIATVVEHQYVDGLAVLGVMFEVVDDENDDLDNFLDSLENVPDPNSETALDDDDEVFPIGKLLPRDLNDFYFYTGSLTTPGCFEVVSWTVFSDKVPISGSQLARFRALRQDSSHRLMDNFRPVQAHNGRNVYHRSAFHEPAAHAKDHKDSHGAHDWTYTGTAGPENWAKMFDTCAGQHQSPIDIDTNEAIKAEMDPLRFRNYMEKPATMTIHNNGHTAQLGAQMVKMPEVAGGALQDVYEFLQLHFHWGAESDVGSEHTVNGKSSPLEMHIVHFNSKYASAADVIKNKPVDGLAVIGVMFEVTEEDNPAWETLIKALDRITHPGNKTEIEHKFSIGSLLPEDRNKFYSYSGSLTTPGCYEIVSWTVLHDRVPISNAQLDHFRDLETSHDHKLVNNYRPTQPHNGRSILVRHIPDPVMAGASTVSATLFLSLLMFLVAKLF